MLSFFTSLAFYAKAIRFSFSLHNLLLVYPIFYLLCSPPYQLCFVFNWFITFYFRFRICYFVYYWLAGELNCSNCRKMKNFLSYDWHHKPKGSEYFDKMIHPLMLPLSWQFIEYLSKLYRMFKSKLHLYTYSNFLEHH